MIEFGKECEDLICLNLEIFENVFYQSKMLINLINDLLDLAKMDSLNFKFNNEYFDLADLV